MSVVELTGVYFSNQDVIKSVGDVVGIANNDNFYAFYGTRNSMGALRKIMLDADSKGVSVKRVHIECECGLISPGGAYEENLENIGLINTRYANKSVRNKLIEAVKPSLKKSELAKYNIDEILANADKERIGMIKKSFPNLKVLAFKYKNLNFDDKPNTLAIILDNSAILKDETLVVGLEGEAPKLSLSA